LTTGGTLANVHHGTYAELDHMGVGDICALTVEAYFAAPKRLYLPQDELDLTP
jgi:hypothetical protein